MKSVRVVAFFVNFTCLQNSAFIKKKKIDNCIWLWFWKMDIYNILCILGPGTRMPVPQTFNPSVPPPLENTWMMPPPSSVPPLNFMKFPPPPEVTYPQDKDPKHKPSPRGHQKQGWSPREENVKEGSRQGDTRGKRREVGGEGKKWTQVCIPLI